MTAWARPLVALGVAGLIVSACSSSGGGVPDASAARLRAGFAKIEADDGYSVDFSVARQQGSAEERTLSCLAIESDPQHPDGDHLAITNWGASTVLDADGGCQGGGTGPRTVVVDGADVLLVAGPAPTAHPACGSLYRRNSVTAAVRAELTTFAHSQGPDVDHLLTLATGASSDGSTMRLDVDPAKAAAAARSASDRSAGSTPDAETMTVDFASAKSTTIRSIEVAARRGDDTVYLRVKYFKIAPQYNSVQPADACIDRSTGSVDSLDQLKSALGF